MKENPQSLPRLVPMVIEHERRNGLVPTSVRTNPFLLVSVFLAKDIIIGLLNNAVSVESCFKKHGHPFGFKNGGKSITPESAFPSSSSSRKVPSTYQLHTVDTQGTDLVFNRKSCMLLITMLCKDFPSIVVNKGLICDICHFARLRKSVLCVFLINRSVPHFNYFSRKVQT